MEKIKFKTVIDRHFISPIGKGRVLIKTISLETGFDTSFGLCKWSNCLYIEFKKNDFPELVYPKWVDKSQSGSMMSTYDYRNCSLANLDWHGGITYYSETTHNNGEYVLVKAGCDYQHLYDNETYGMDDCGESILENDGSKILKQFKQMIQELQK